MHFWCLERVTALMVVIRRMIRAKPRVELLALALAPLQAEREPIRIRAVRATAWQAPTRAAVNPMDRVA